MSRTETTRPRKSRNRLAALRGIVADMDAGRHVQGALGIEPNFFWQLVDGGYAEVREEGRHPVTGRPYPHAYGTEKARDLLNDWQGHPATPSAEA